MTASTKMPSKGSGTYMALQYLARAGGRSTALDLMTQLSWTDTPGRFQRLIVGPLERLRLVMRRDDAITLTSRGATVLTPAAGETSTATVPMPTPLHARPLSARYRSSARVTRPGSLDYRDIPSRIGDQVVPHGEKAAA